MNWLLAAIIAQVILGTSLVFDKILLKKSCFNPWVYTFWLGIFGAFAFLFIPFSFDSSTLSASLFAIALLAGVFFILAMFFLFYALARGEASVTLPIIGGFSPLFTLAFGEWFLESRLAGGDLFAFFFFVLGGLIFYRIESKDARPALAGFTVASAASFGISTILSKLVFESVPFLTGFILIKSGGFFFVILLLLIPHFRKRLYDAYCITEYASKTLYVVNRLYASAGSVLVALAVSLAHPALVDATQSIKYAVVFFVAWFVLAERYEGKMLAGKMTATILITTGLVWLGFASYARSIPVDSEREVVWGVTYSRRFARGLGVDWQGTFDAILRDLGPKKIRLAAYWDEIEKSPREFDFSELDWLVRRAGEAGADVTLVVGLKVPRWPECSFPAWVYGHEPIDREAALRSYIQHVVERYRLETTISRWQVENEPFLWFGKCPRRGYGFLEEEIALVRAIDPARPILVTDSGEFGLWARSVLFGDEFGTTMYRKVYNRGVSPFLGVIEYPLAPSFFRLKEQMVRFFTGTRDKPFLVVELQAEPWGTRAISEMTYEEQIELFSPDYFGETLHYARDTGFSEYYLWGVEWWYFVGKKYEDWRYWEIGREILSE